jgi:hypothetical protein
MNPAKNSIFLRSDRDAQDEARFCAETFADPSVDVVHVAPDVFPMGVLIPPTRLKFPLDRS